MTRARFHGLTLKMMEAFGSGEKGSARRYYRYRRLWERWSLVW